jgi:precorrin-4/cobalt-precorrin-4 C11-methyltransferase
MLVERHPILFVGAGPGDPELITVKGQRALAAADAVLYTGSLVPEALLQWARPQARRESSAGMDLAAIVAFLREAWDQGQRVVRLHTGDPSLYGAIFEQMAALDELGIGYRVIPGVTAAMAAAAALNLEFTLPEVSQTLILTRIEGRTPVPEGERLEDLAAHGASLAIYLSAGLAPRVAEVLRGAYGDEAPCAVVCRASQPDQRILHTTAARLAADMEAAGIDRQAVILAGRVLAVAREALAHRSRLYDREFDHGYRSRKGKSEIRSSKSENGNSKSETPKADT